jgi:hypothetical protein
MHLVSCWFVGLVNDFQESSATSNEEEAVSNKKEYLNGYQLCGTFAGFFVFVSAERDFANLSGNQPHEADKE